MASGVGRVKNGKCAVTNVKQSRRKSNTTAYRTQFNPFGTSQKDVPSSPSLKEQINRLRSKRKSEKCINNAPYICIPPENGKAGRIFQGCCNSWTCPRCGLMRANEEYARICQGTSELHKMGYDLYEITITCKGEISSSDAEKEYLENTNRLLSVFRAHVKKNEGFWAYCQVTERQRRKHPHSHFIMTCIPSDAYPIKQHYELYCQQVKELNEIIPVEMRYSPRELKDIDSSELFSMWFVIKCWQAGLGVQCHISRVRSVKAIAMYLAKYMFKAALQTKWPKGWKRIRYSQNWPKLDNESNPNAFPVLTREDWFKVSRITGLLVTDDPAVYERCLLRGVYNIKCSVENHIDVPPERGKDYAI